MSEAPDRRFDVTLDSLERSAHVPPQEQTEEVAEREQDGSSWAWDEERRQGGSGRCLDRRDGCWDVAGSAGSRSAA